MSKKQISEKKIQFIDLELLCWEPSIVPSGQSKHIIQIGLVEIDAIQLDILRKQSYFVRPNFAFEVSKFCTDLTGITQEQLIKKGRPFPEVIRSIQKNWGTSGKVTYAWGDDNEPIREHCTLYNIPNPWAHTGIWDFGVFFRSAHKLQRRLPLTKALEHLKLTFEGRAHDALTDATNLAILHNQMMTNFRQNKIL